MSTQLEKTSDKAPQKTESKAYQRPYYQVVREDAVYNVNVYLPGVEHDKASITVDNNTITVEAERSPHWKGRGRFVQREIQAAAYRLHLELNVPVDSEKIVAKSKNGILTIHLPVAEKAKPKKITIQ